MEQWYYNGSIPKPKVNGGLYTGTPFQKGAPWGNVPVVPDVAYMTNVNLRSADPPPGALFQYPGSTRPGNNEQNMPGISHQQHQHHIKRNSNFE
jgi:hypothetical protein